MGLFHWYWAKQTWAMKHLWVPGIVYSHLFASPSNPCFEGVCSVVKADYTMTIRGPPVAIGDLTEVGGWTPDKTACADTKSDDVHVFTMTCNDEDLCKHLEEGGAVGKVVRVPSGCSPTGFAVLVALEKGSEESYSVKVDPHFRPGTPSKGTVTFELKAATTESDNEPGVARRSFVSDSSLDSIADEPKSKLEKRFDINEHIPFRINKSLKDLKIISRESACEPRKRVKKTREEDLSLESDERLHSKRWGKVGMKAGFDVSVSASVAMHVGTGLKAVGTLFPPNLEKFELYGTMDGKVSGSIKISGSAEGELSTDDIKLLNIPIPGIPSIPPILTVGPTFQLVVRGDLKVNASLEQEVGFGYHFDKVRLFIPEFQDNEKTSRGVINPIPAKQSLKLGTAAAQLETTVRVTPRLAFGISSFGHDMDAHVEAELSGVAGLTLERLQSKEETPTKEKSTDDNFKRAERSGFLAKRDALSDLGLKGCSYVNFGVALNVGVSLDLLTKLGVLDSNPSKTLFERTYEVFKKCSEDAPKAKAKIPAPKVHAYVIAYDRVRWIPKTKPSFRENTKWDTTTKSSWKRHTNLLERRAIESQPNRKVTAPRSWRRHTSSLERRAIESEPDKKKSLLKCKLSKQQNFKTIMDMMAVGEEVETQ